MLSETKSNQSSDGLVGVTTLYPHGLSDVSSDCSFLSEELGTVQGTNFSVIKPDVKNIIYKPTHKIQLNQNGLISKIILCDVPVNGQYILNINGHNAMTGKLTNELTDGLTNCIFDIYAKKNPINNNINLPHDPLDVYRCMAVDEKSKKIPEYNRYLFFNRIDSITIQTHHVDMKPKHKILLSGYFDDYNIGTWTYRDDVEIEYEIYDEKTKFHYYAVQEELSSVKQLTFTNVNSHCDFNIKLIIDDTSYGPFKSKNNMIKFRFKGFNNKNANLTHDLNRDCFTGYINIIPSVKSLMMTKLEYHTYNHLGLPVN